MKPSYVDLSLKTIQVLLEFLVQNNVSVHMIGNHILAIRVMAIVYDMPFAVLEHPKVKYPKISKE